MCVFFVSFVCVFTVSYRASAGCVTKKLALDIIDQTRASSPSSPPPLAATFALAVVASATDVYITSYETATNDCTGTLDPYKQTLDLGTSNNGAYTKLALRGTSYSWAVYTDSACTTSASTIVLNPFTSETYACIA